MPAYRCSGSDIRREAMGVLEAGRRRAQRGIEDVVRIPRASPARDHVQAGVVPHAIGNCMIGAGTITADAESPDDLPAGIQRYPAAEGDDAAGNLADRIFVWIVEVGVVRVR